MTPLALISTNVLSVATFMADALIVLSAIIIAVVILKKPYPRLHAISRKAADHALLAGLIISSGSVLASLFYSNIIGFPPCELCWWQRVFIFPQVVLFAVAFYNERKNKITDEMVFVYSLILSLMGGVIALYNYIGQFSPSLLTACGAGPSCAQIFFTSFGYITIPMMSLTAYLLLIIVFFFRRHGKRL